MHFQPAHTYPAIRVTKMLDCAKDFTDDPEAVVTVVGQLPDGKWLAILAFAGKFIEVN